MTMVTAHISKRPEPVQRGLLPHLVTWTLIVLGSFSAGRPRPVTSPEQAWPGKPARAGSANWASDAPRRSAAAAAGRGISLPGLPPAARVGNTSSQYVSRAITPNVVGALVNALTASGVDTAVVLGCDMFPQVAVAIAARMRVRCMGSAGGGGSSGSATARRLLALDVNAGGGGGGGRSGVAANKAVVQLRTAAASLRAEVPVTAALAEQLLATMGVAAPGGGGSGADVGLVAYAEVAVNASMPLRPLRALLVAPPGWPGGSGASGDGGGSLQAWFTETSHFRDVFNAVYKEAKWGADGGGSGIGSSMAYTEEIRKALPQIIKDYKITSMLDSSCGSMHWMPLVLAQVEKEQPNFRFHGSDVVCPLINKHTATYVNKTNWQFSCVDYAHQPLAKGYDLVWSRDSLQHVPFNAAWQFLNNVKASGAKYLLVGSYITETGSNSNITAGAYYRPNLLEPPFSLRPKPLAIIDEQSAKHQPGARNPERKYMLLFDMRTLVWDDALSHLM